MKTDVVFVYKNVWRNKNYFENCRIIYRVIRYKKKQDGWREKRKMYISLVGFPLIAAATAAPSATSAPKPSFPGPGAAAGTSTAVAAPLWVRPEAVLILVSLRLALGYRFGS